MSGVKCIGYVRVSQVGGREGDSFISPALQREQIEAVARREGLTIVRVIEELDASGGDSERPGWNEAIGAVESGEAQGIACWNVSRFSRSTRDFLNAWDRIERAGGRLYSATEDLSNKFMRTVLVGVAEMERDRQRDGFRAAQQSAVARGIHVAGRIPLGYTRDPETRRLVPNELAPVVVAVFERKAAGASNESLARFVHEQGVEAFSTTGVRWMLQNRAYLGEAKGGGAVTEGAHPALVTKALFARCQGRGVKSARSGKLAGRYLLQGVARCAGCGRGLYLSTSGAGRAFYRCRTTGCGERGYAGANELDSFVLNVIEGTENPTDPSTWVALPGGGSEVEDAEQALADARADLDGYLSDTTLRRSLGAERYNEAVSDYVAVVNKCESDLAEAREATTGGWELVGRLWNTAWGHAERKEWTERMVRTCVVTKGRGPLSGRVEVELR